MANKKMGVNQITVLTVSPENAARPRRFLSVFLNNIPVLADREWPILAGFRLVWRTAIDAASGLAEPSTMKYCGLLDSSEIEIPKSTTS